MSQAQDFSSVNTINERYYRIAARWMAGFIGFLQMWYLTVELYRHWPVFDPSSRALLVSYLVSYPVIWFFLTKKNANPFVTALLVYGAFGVANLLMFSVAR